jgi:predicted nucleic acid-binding protein
MRSLVLDASAALTYLLDEPGAARVERELEARNAVLVPWLFWTEVVNVLARRHRWPGSDVLAAVYDLEQSGIRTSVSSRQMTLAVIDAVEVHGLSAYDAEYLVLGESEDADLLTADGFLARAAGSRAVLVGAPRRLAELPEPYRPDTRVPPEWPRWHGAAAYLEDLRREAQRDLDALEGTQTGANVAARSHA